MNFPLSLSAFDKFVPRDEMQYSDDTIVVSDPNYAHRMFHAVLNKEPIFCEDVMFEIPYWSWKFTEFGNTYDCMVETFHIKENTDGIKYDIPEIGDEITFITPLPDTGRHCLLMNVIKDEKTWGGILFSLRRRAQSLVKLERNT